MEWKVVKTDLVELAAMPRKNLNERAFLSIAAVLKVAFHCQQRNL